MRERERGAVRVIGGIWKRSLATGNTLCTVNSGATACLATKCDIIICIRNAKCTHLYLAGAAVAPAAAGAGADTDRFSRRDYVQCAFSILYILRKKINRTRAGTTCDAIFGFERNYSSYTERTRAQRAGGGLRSSSGSSNLLS